MLDKQELQVQQKREVDKKTESTAPGRVLRTGDRYLRNS